MECLSAFRRQVPEVEFDLTGNIENQTQLDINNYDMLIYPDIHKYEKFIGMPLYEEKYCLAVPVNHPLADRPVIRAKMLEGEDIVFLRSGRSGEEFPFQICSALAIRFSSVCYADTRDLHRQMIADGLCVGFVPAGLSGFYKDDAVTLIPVSDQRFTRRMMICFRREKHLTSRVREFSDFVLSWFNIGENG